MRKPRPGLVLCAAIPFLAGCFHIQAQPLPAPEARGSIDIRGVVLRGNEEAPIEFERLEQVQWTDSAVVITGVLASSVTSGAQTVTTRSFPFADLAAVLVRQLDANRTSLFIGGVAVGSIAIATFLLTGQTDETTVLDLIRN